ncbi:MAG: hypothetical protein JST00_03910 [Deltaproteobacteria bacterium]|nr:hypothetical protein [Deltaproteobacteria bacterium]
MRTLASIVSTASLLVVSGLAASACSSSSESSSGGSGAPPAATSPPSDTAVVTCEEGKYRTSANQCETFPNVAVKRADVIIGPVRDHHTTIVTEIDGKPWLYVFGGTDDWKVMHDDVQRAPIGDGGTLGKFELAGKLPAPRAGHCIVPVKDRWLLVGGTVASAGRQTASTSSLYVKLAADGKVAETAPGPDLPMGVMHLSCNAAGDWIYAQGGRNRSSHSTSMSVRAKIGADGVVGAFESQPALSPDRSHHAAFVREKRLYIVGGLTGDPTADYTDRSDVIMADIGDDGALGPWTPAGKLPATLSVSSAQLYKDAVYMVGGLEGLGFTDKIRRATFNADGTLSEIATVPGKLPSARGHVHQTPMYKTYFFSVGGKDDGNNSLGTVDIGQFQ